MKTLFTAVALAAGIALMSGGAAMAKTAAECDAEGWVYANQYYNANQSVAAAALGATFGVGVAAVTQNNLWVGAWGGALGGLLINAIATQQRKQRLHDVYVYYCNQGATVQPVQPVYGPPPPPPPPQPGFIPSGSFLATVYVDLNIRDGGGTQYAVRFVLHPGQQFTAACDVPYPGWCLVTLPNGQTGYGYKPYIYAL